MVKYLKKRVALVTGGFTGIGFAVCKSLAHCGADIAMCARSVDENKTREIEAIGQRVYSGSIDVRSSPSVNEFTDAVVSELGTVDILVNCAGISARQTVESHTDALWDDVIETNLGGPFRLIRACLPAMKQQQWGRIINIGSTAARTARADYPAYCASKSGLLGLSRAVALEGAPHGIGCVMVSPTWVETKMLHESMTIKAEQNAASVEQVYSELLRQSPQQRLVQPEEVGELVSFLCRNEAIGITMEDIQINAASLW